MTLRSSIGLVVGGVARTEGGNGELMSPSQVDNCWRSSQNDVRKVGVELMSPSQVEMTLRSSMWRSSQKVEVRS